MDATKGPYREVKRGRAAWALALPLTITLIGFIQWQARAWTAGYTAFPDEPSHFVGGLMVRDFLASGSLHPVQFAENYYVHQPFFAIGYWPPFFYVLEGLWMLLFGYSRPDTMIFVGVLAAAVSLLLFGYLRPRVPLLLALTSIAIFLTIPSVQWSSAVVMTDLGVATLCLAATLAMGEYMESPGWRWAVLGGVLGGLAFLTKYLAGFLFLPPILVILIDRRWNLLRLPATWTLAGIVTAICLPWLVWSHRLMAIGFDDSPRNLGKRFFLVGNLLLTDLGIILVSAAVLATLWAMFNWRTLPALQRLFCLQLPCLCVFLAAGPTPDIERRYLIVAYPAMLAIIAVAVQQMASRRRSLYYGVLALLAVAAISYLRAGVSHVYTEIPRRVATDLIAGSPAAAVLVPTSAEGQMIAELAAAQTVRSKMILVRPSKVLARMTWTGAQYESLVQSVAEMSALFDRYPIDVVILANRNSGDDPPHNDPPHDRILHDMLSGDPRWIQSRRYSEPGAEWVVYRRQNNPGLTLEPLLSLIRTRTRSIN